MPYDVIRARPKNDRLFVEAVNAWGRASDLRAEPRLLPMVSWPLWEADSNSRDAGGPRYP